MINAKYGMGNAESAEFRNPNSTMSRYGSK